MASIPAPKNDEAPLCSFSLALKPPCVHDAKIYIRFSHRAKCLLLNITTGPLHGSKQTSDMGSFVYAVPGVGKEVLCTTIYGDERSLEFGQRIAKAVARETHKPTYVTSSLTYESLGVFGMVDEMLEIDRFVRSELFKYMKASDEE